MPTFTVHSKDSAPQDSHQVLEKVQSNYGFIPNLLGVLAEAPVAAEAYLNLIDLCRQSSLTPTERHIVWFAVNYEHDCTYCMAAHTVVAESENVAVEVIEETRNGIPYRDGRLQELREFTQTVVVERGNVSPERVERFLAAGFTKQNVLEVITAITSKILSNYVNHIAKTPLDEAFSACAWKKPGDVSVA